MSETPDDRPGRSGTDADPTANPSAYDDFPIQVTHYGESSYVGGVGEGGPWFFSQRENAFFEGEYDEANERVVPTGEERELNPDESVGAAIERLGDELGLDSLSKWAEEHLEGDDEGDRENRGGESRGEERTDETRGDRTENDRR